MRTSACGRDPTVPLGGEWEFTTDPDDAGLEEGWHEPGAPLPGARTVAVPHAWQEEDDLVEYTGVGWYERTFEAPAVGPGEVALVRFGAVDWEATVYVNGERVGREREGYLPFAVDVTDALVAGENTLSLRVRDPEDLSEIPHGKQGDPWYTRVSGPWQRVDLVVLDGTHLTDLRVDPDLSDDTAAVALSATAGDVEAAVAVEREGKTVAEATVTLDADGEGSAVLDPGDADYWTPEDPALYDVAVTLEADGEAVDRYRDRFGMRSIEVVDGEWFLNGDPLFVRGALDQAFYPDTYYRPSDLSLYEEEIRTAKELGFNMLRKHIKPAHPEFLRLADELGMLVWQEPANPTVHTPASRERVERQLFGTIDRDYNRPSVVAWSLYNEEWGIGGLEEETSLWEDGAKQEYLADLYRETRERDPTRLVCDNSGWAHVATDINDYHEYFVLPDRAGAWRERLDAIADAPGGNYAAERTDPAAAPLVVSEFGTWGFPGVAATEEHYGGDPNWFDHGFREGTLAHPDGVRERFAESHLSGAFDDIEALAGAWQRREFDSVAASIADMREHEAVSGYCITEFSDIEWEFNGVLDYYRDGKAFHDAFARLNAPVAAYLDLEAGAVWAGDRVTGDVILVNDTGEPVTATVEWSAFGDGGAVEATVDPFGTARIGGAVDAAAPAVDAPESSPISLDAAEPVRALSRDVTVVPGESTPVEGSVYAEPPLAGPLADRGHGVVGDLDDATLAVVTDPGRVEAFVEGGGDAVVVPPADGHPVGTDLLSYTDLPESRSWNLCASFLHQELLAGVDRVPGWAFEGLYPYAYVDAIAGDDEVLAGYTEGWLRNTGAVALARPLGAGTLAASTFRVAEGYGDHPAATAVLDALLAAAQR